MIQGHKFKTIQDKRITMIQKYNDSITRVLGYKDTGIH